MAHPDPKSGLASLNLIDSTSRVDLLPSTGWKKHCGRERESQNWFLWRQEVSISTHPLC